MPPPVAQTTGSLLRRKAAAFHSREREGTGTPGMTGTPLPRSGTSSVRSSAIAGCFLTSNRHGDRRHGASTPGLREDYAAVLIVAFSPDANASIESRSLNPARITFPDVKMRAVPASPR